MTQDLRYVQVHRLIALAMSAMLSEAGMAAFDLNTTAGLLLYVLYVCTLMADNLSSKIEAGNGLKVYWNLLFGPFAAPKLVAFDLFWLTASEASLIDKVWKLLLHHIVDFGHCFFKAVFGGTCDMEIKRRILKERQQFL